ncbi:MAG: TlpA family protein disulfide reductase [Bacteroidetes bacterium]|jgi:thiol-disulfide isomerase/thioredoxin|nr:TlpA family protein disulfide reductase [Bacteroidota bacterium]
MKKVIVLWLILSVCTHGHSQKIKKWKITDVEKMMQWKDSGILVINFWATFCKPCVAEIPGFMKVISGNTTTKATLVLISLDLPAAYPARIDSFVTKHQYKAKFAWLDETNADYFCPRVHKIWSGAIPATYIINTNTGYRRFYEKELSEAEFREAMEEAAARNKEIKNLEPDIESSPKLEMAPVPPGN